MSDSQMIEGPSTEQMLACSAGIAADGHELKPATPSSDPNGETWDQALPAKCGGVTNEYLGTHTPAAAPVVTYT